MTRRRAAALVALAHLGLAGGAIAQQDTLPARPDSAAVVADSLVGRPATTAADTTARAAEVSAQDSPEDRGLVIRTADRSLQLRILGSIRVFGSYDFQGLPRADAFSPLEIPVPDDGGVDRFYMDARQTRLGFETTWRRPESSHTLFARIEADFSGAGEAFRLRHAYIRVDDNRVIIGQTWTAFTDIAAVPLTVDLDGPASSIILRSAQVRYTHPLGDGLTLAGSVETPSADIGSVSSLTDESYQSFPDVVAQLRVVRPTVRAQGALLVRVLSAPLDSVARERVVGAGAMGSVRVTLGPTSSLSAQAVLGAGISRYVRGVSGRGFDLVLDPTDSSYVAPTLRGAYVAYSFVPRAQVSVSAILGGLWAPAEDFYPPSSYRSGGTFALNAFAPVFPGMTVGAEAIVGWRRNLDGQSGDALRLQARATYEF